MMFATFSLCALFFKNAQQSRSLFQRFQSFLLLTDDLIEIESLFGDVHVDDEYDFFLSL